MSNRKKMLQSRLIPPALCVAGTAAVLAASFSVAPHVGSAGFYDFWLGAFSVVTFLGAAVFAIFTVIATGLSVVEWLDE